METATNERAIAEIIYKMGFPPRMKEKLGENFEGVADAYLDILIEKRSEIYSIEKVEAFSSETGEARFLDDFGEKAMQHSPVLAYMIGIKASNSDLVRRAEDAILESENPRSVYLDVRDSASDDFISRLIDKAIEVDPRDADGIAAMHKEIDGGKLWRDLAPKLAPHDIRLAHFVARYSENENALESIREQWLTKDPAEAFYAGDKTLEKMVVETSPECIPGDKLYFFVSREMAENEDLLNTARRRYANEDPGSAISSDDIILRELALQNVAKIPAQNLYEASQRHPDLKPYAYPRISEETGIPISQIREMYS